MVTVIAYSESSYSPFDLLVENCKTLTTSLVNVKFTFAKWSANFVAHNDAIATYGSKRFYCLGVYRIYNNKGILLLKKKKKKKKRNYLLEQNIYFF